MRVVEAFLAGLLTFTLSYCGGPAYAQPAASLPYQRALVRESRLIDGLNGPVALYAGQIEQESGWDQNAKSAYANGLAQFTPTTAQWISGVYSDELGHADVFNPEWAIRAMLRYDARLFGGLSAADDCERWAFALSAYNGGIGWVSRDRSLCAAHGCRSAVWFGEVENYTARSAAAAKENRAYPRRILLTTQQHYKTWGATVSCGR